MEDSRVRKGWTVTFAGLGVNLILGVLYAWGVISAALIDQLGWTATSSQIPYMVACAVFALSMVPGGRYQDKLGPKPIIIFSAVLAGVGFIMAGIFLTVIGLTIFYGIVFGLAMGMGYSAPTPAAVKWFGFEKRGLISGIVVSGFGLAPIYIAPLTTYLLNSYGIRTTFFIMGVGFFGIIITLAQFISNPPKEYLPASAKGRSNLPEEETAKRDTIDYDWREVLRTPQFYLLWLMFTFGTFAGLLLIGQLSKIGLEQAGITTAYSLVAVYALFNFSGRIGCGVISDRLGRMRTLFIMFIVQGIVFAVFGSMTTPITLMICIALIGFTFGGMLTLFPAATGDYFGMKNFGVNYGMLITAWGVGGVFGPLLGGLVRDTTGTYVFSYTISAILSLLGAFLSFVTKPPLPVKTSIKDPGIGTVQKPIG